MRIINLAYLMLTRHEFDVEAYLARLQPKMFGIDLHWLPHAQGALATAEMIKRQHPATPVLMGGLSASYYHTELAAYPFVDYVLRGDSTEEPCLPELSDISRGATAIYNGPVIIGSADGAQLAWNNHSVSQLQRDQASKPRKALGVARLKGLPTWCFA